MRYLLPVMFMALAGLVSAPTVAQLQIEITRGIDNPTPIAVVPFGWSGAGTSPEDVARIIDGDLARKIVKMIKETKIKVQTAIQGEKLRVTGKKRDDLQQVIAMLKDAKLGIPLQYDNFRD